MEEGGHEVSIRFMGLSINHVLTQSPQRSSTHNLVYGLPSSLIQVAIPRSRSLEVRSQNPHPLWTWFRKNQSF